LIRAYCLEIVGYFLVSFFTFFASFFSFGDSSDFFFTSLIDRCSLLIMVLRGYLTDGLRLKHGRPAKLWLIISALSALPSTKLFVDDDHDFDLAKSPISPV